MSATQPANEPQKQVDKPIFVHGRFYKAQTDTDGTYIGLNLTEKDCLKIVDQFYEDKKNKKFYYANYEHSPNKSEILGFVDDIYYSTDTKSLHTIFRVLPKQSKYQEVKKKLQNFEQKKKEADTSNGQLAIKDMVGLSIELDYEYAGVDENNMVVSLKELDVTQKKLRGIGIVSLPDHYNDDTFVTSYTENSVTDLFQLDPILKEYVKKPDSRPEIKSKNTLTNTDTDKNINVTPDENKQANKIIEEKDNNTKSKNQDLKTEKPVQNQPSESHEKKIDDNPQKVQSQNINSSNLPEENNNQQPATFVTNQDPPKKMAEKTPTTTGNIKEEEPETNPNPKMDTGDTNQQTQQSSNALPMSIDPQVFEAMVQKAVQEQLRKVESSKKRKEPEPKPIDESAEDSASSDTRKSKRVKFANGENDSEEPATPSGLDKKQPTKTTVKKNEQTNSRDAESEKLQLESYIEALKKAQEMRHQDPVDFHKQQLKNTQNEVASRQNEVINFLLDGYQASTVSELPGDIQDGLSSAFANGDKSFWQSPLVASVQAARHGLLNHSSQESRFQSMRSAPIRLNGYSADLPPINRNKQQREPSDFELAVARATQMQRESRSRMNQHNHNNNSGDDDMDVDNGSSQSQSYTQDYRSSQQQQQQQQKNKPFAPVNRHLGMHNQEGYNQLDSKKDRTVENALRAVESFMQEKSSATPNSPFIETANTALKNFLQQTIPAGNKSTTYNYLNPQKNPNTTFGQGVIHRIFDDAQTVEDLTYYLDKQKCLHPNVLHVYLDNMLRGGSGLPEETKRSLNSAINFNVENYGPNVQYMQDF